MLLLLTGAVAVHSEELSEQSDQYTDLQAPQPHYTNTETFLYRLDRFIQKILLNELDSSYLTFHENCWRLSFTNSETGNLTGLQAYDIINKGNVALNIHSRPSVDLGFDINYRGISLSFAWDPLHSYTQKFNFAFYGRTCGIEISHYTYANMSGDFQPVGNNPPIIFKDNDMEIKTTLINLFYAFNYKKYSPSASIRQGYRQLKPAGSFLVNAQYRGNSFVTVNENITEGLNYINEINLYQIALGAGYGYNYTPNRGKVMLHISAMPMIVVFNHAVFTWNDKIGDTPIQLSSVPKPRFPVYFTGTARASVAWEANKWVSLAAYGQFNNIRFRTKETQETENLRLNSWDWSVNILIGVRFGVKKERVKAVLEAHDEKARNGAKVFLPFLDK